MSGVRIPARSGENAIFGSVSVDSIYADVAELADALDLGSSGLPVQVQVLSSALDNNAPKPARLGTVSDFFYTISYIQFGVGEW